MTISDGRPDANSPLIASIGGGVLSFGNLTLSNMVVSDNAVLRASTCGAFGRPCWVTAGGLPVSQP